MKNKRCNTKPIEKELIAQLAGTVRYQSTDLNKVKQVLKHLTKHMNDLAKGPTRTDTLITFGDISFRGEYIKSIAGIDTCSYPDGTRVHYFTIFFN